MQFALLTGLGTSACGDALFRPGPTVVGGGAGTSGGAGGSGRDGAVDIANDAGADSVNPAPMMVQDCTLGPAGGILQLGEATVTFPPGALAARECVKMRKVASREIAAAAKGPWTDWVLVVEADALPAHGDRPSLTMKLTALPDGADTKGETLTFGFVKNEAGGKLLWLPFVDGGTVSIDALEGLRLPMLRLDQENAWRVAGESLRYHLVIGIVSLCGGSPQCGARPSFTCESGVCQ